jgi:hypothetical protein
MPGDDVDERDHIDRLGQIVAGAQRPSPDRLTPTGIRGQHHDRDVARARITLQPLENFDPGDVGQVKVEDDQVRLLLTRQLESQRALHGGEQLDPGITLENLLDERQIREIVLDVENSPSLAGRLKPPQIGVLEQLAATAIGVLGYLGYLQFDEEGTADARLGRDVDRASHCLEQCLAE